MTNEKERMQILETVESGKISAEDGISLLKAMGIGDDRAGPQMAPNGSSETQDAALAVPQPGIDLPSDGGESAAGDVERSPALATQAPSLDGAPPASIALDDETGASQGEDEVEVLYDSMGEELPSSLPPDALKWKRWWMIPLWVGVVITISGGFLMFTALERSGMGLGFMVGMMVLGAVRELLGSGMLLGYDILGVKPLLFFVLPSAGFFVVGLMMAFFNWIEVEYNRRKEV